MNTTELWIDSHGIDEVLRHYDIEEHRAAIWNLTEDIVCLKKDIEILKSVILRNTELYYETPRIDVFKN